MDGTFVKVPVRWRATRRAADQYGQTLEILLSDRRNQSAGQWFFTR
ncbi:DDE-type integrase/transposase/recombinase [Sedimentimonas flavescens]